MPTPAFPGAEGFGNVSVGGRGDGAGSGQVIHVTNLNTDGPGSYFAAVKAVGPRVVVFDVSGVINQDKPLTYTQPYLTVAGQTSPGGICFSGEEHRIQSHDITLRHIRVRHGDVDSPRDGYDATDAMNSGDPDDQFLASPWTTYNVMLDHCSLSWAIDETLTLWYQSHDISVQKCITAEALMHSFHQDKTHTFLVPHSMGMLCGIAAHSLSYHHNLLANCNQRMPQFAGDLDPTNRGFLSTIDFRCNTVFNWGQEPCALEHLGNRVNFVNNYYKLGPDFNRNTKTCVRFANDVDDLASGNLAQMYMTGNVTPNNPDGSLDNWQADVRNDDGSIPDPVTHRLGAPIAVPAVTTEAALTAYQLVLNDVGATKPFRDSTDLRTLMQVRKRCRKPTERYFIDSQSQVGGWPFYDTAAVGPTDTNGDGIPDSYCVAHGLSPTANIASFFSDDGIYTWIERWTHFLAGDPGAT